MVSRHCLLKNLSAVVAIDWIACCGVWFVVAHVWQLCVLVRTKMMAKGELG